MVIFCLFAIFSYDKILEKCYLFNQNLYYSFQPTILLVDTSHRIITVLLSCNDAKSDRMKTNVNTFLQFFNIQDNKYVLNHKKILI